MGSLDIRKGGSRSRSRSSRHTSKAVMLLFHVLGKQWKGQRKDDTRLSARPSARMGGSGREDLAGDGGFRAMSHACTGSGQVTGQTDAEKRSQAWA